MKRFEIYISHVSWASDGKHRPVLVFSTEGDEIAVYAITTQYESKSQAMQLHYFKINDWKRAGLDYQSYIDTKGYLPISTNALKGKIPLGELTSKDKKRFLEFLAKKER